MKLIAFTIFTALLLASSAKAINGGHAIFFGEGRQAGEMYALAYVELYYPAIEVSEDARVEAITDLETQVDFLVTYTYGEAGIETNYDYLVGYETGIWVIIEMLEAPPPFASELRDTQGARLGERAERVADY